MDLAQGLIEKALTPVSDFKLGSLIFSPSYIQAGAIIFLIFILVLTMAQVRRHFIDWSVKGALFGLFFGFVLAIILEGFLIIGGKTFLAKVFGWQNPPKPLVDLIENSRSLICQP